MATPYEVTQANHMEEALPTIATFGSTAVQSETYRVSHLFEASSIEQEETDDNVMRFIENHALASFEHGLTVAEDIKAVRQRLGIMTVHQSNCMENAIAGNVPLLFLNASVAQVIDPASKELVGYTKIPYATWLSDERLSSDEQVLNFLQWNEHDLRATADDPEVQTAIRSSRRKFGEALVHAIALKNWLPHSTKVAPAVYESQHIPISLGDVFDTDAQERLGYHDNGHIVLGALAVKAGMEQDKLDWLVWHELVHGTIGRMPLGRWINEALTSQITSVLVSGQSDEFDPSKRTDGYESYFEERRLLAAVQGFISKTDSGRLAYHAYYSKQDFGRETRTWMEQIDKGARKYFGHEEGTYFLAGICDEVEQLELQLGNGKRGNIYQSEACKQIADKLLANIEKTI